MDLSIVRVVFGFYPAKGGSVTHIIELSRKMQSPGVQQVIIAPRFEGEYQDFDDSLNKDYGIKIYRVNYSKFKLLKRLSIPVIPFVFFTYSFNVIRQIMKMKNQSHKINVIEVHGDLLGQIIIALKRIARLKIPVLIMQHGVGEIIKQDQCVISPSQKVTLFLLNFIKPDYFLMLDDGTRIDLYLNELQIKNIPYAVVYHGIDTSFFKPNEQFHPDKTFVILSTHRFNSFKRLDLAIIAYKKFIEQIEDRNSVCLNLVGSGPCRNELVKLANDMEIIENIRFIDEQDIEEIRNSITSADVIIGTSLVSNLNRVVQEAMACGKPVVVFDSGNIHRLIKDMENGVLVKSGDVDDFALKLKLVYDNIELRERLGKNARDTILKHRNWDTRISQELKIFNEILREYK
jgi:Glycosyltransferase